MTKRLLTVLPGSSGRTPFFEAASNAWRQASRFALYPSGSICFRRLRSSYRDSTRRGLDCGQIIGMGMDLGRLTSGKALGW